MIHAISVEPANNVIAINCGAYSNPPLRGTVDLSTLTNLVSFTCKGNHQITNLTGAETLSSLQFLDIRMPKSFYGSFLPLMATDASWDLNDYRYIRDNTVTLSLENDFTAVAGRFALMHDITATRVDNNLTFPDTLSAAPNPNCLVNILTSTKINRVEIQALSAADDDLRIRLDTRAGELTAVDKRWNVGWYAGDTQTWFPETNNGFHTNYHQLSSFRRITIPQLSLPYWRGYFLEEGRKIYIDVFDGWWGAYSRPPWMTTIFYSNSTCATFYSSSLFGTNVASTSTNPASPVPPYSSIYNYGPHFIFYENIGEVTIPTTLNLVPPASGYSMSLGDTFVTWSLSGISEQSDTTLDLEVREKNHQYHWTNIYSNLASNIKNNNGIIELERSSLGEFDVLESRLIRKKGNIYYPLTSREVSAVRVPFLSA